MKWEGTVPGKSKGMLDAVCVQDEGVAIGVHAQELGLYTGDAFYRNTLKVITSGMMPTDPYCASRVYIVVRWVNP